VVAKTTEKSIPRPNTLSEKTNKRVLEQIQAPIDRASKTLLKDKPTRIASSNKIISKNK
jgi:hypothetical protein